MRQFSERVIGHRHGPFLGGLVFALVVMPIAMALAPQLALELVPIAFFVCYLALMWLRLPRLTATFLRRHADTADEPASVILTVTLAAVVVSMVSLFFVLNGAESRALKLVLAFGAVVSGWFTIHTMAAMHYAHAYWRPQTVLPHESGLHRGGLDFPGTTDPGGYDFLYFSFVIGMTAQTSDTAVTTTAMRKLNLLHAVVSYFFNTVLLAAAVNAAVSLAG
ncbi:DUF1345 domain-containing protein [Ciceribacter ferrooxidans]|uniref:DUF1345 domain-containing protein n=1 Tax=Ciceribacter ferrooxidans TaxID=2509717 RepID=A0A4Q2T5K5_9HYPH|nr:DUF1345 domain-containing protein [Ciceribacter ferrooxidans]RYC12380.1 DUF1345 domain-containing protein [Ciceribacter ferrooxidans]